MLPWRLKAHDAAALGLVQPSSSNFWRQHTPGLEIEGLEFRV